MANLIPGSETNGQCCDRLGGGQRALGNPSYPILRFGLEQLPPSLTLASSHEVDLATALTFARNLGYKMPARITIWAVVVQDPFTVSETMSTAVTAALMPCANRVWQAVAQS